MQNELSNKQTKVAVRLNVEAREARAMRRTAPVAIVHNGSRRTVFGCLCGARHTAATDYRNALHVREFLADHERKCAGIFWAQALKKSPDWMASQRDAIYSDDSH